MGTWNVRTMTPGFNGQDLSETAELRKTFTIDKELCRLKVDIAALQETRLAESGSVKENNYTFWQGLAESKKTTLWCRICSKKQAAEQDNHP